MRHLTPFLLLTTALFVAGCDKMSNKATPERLDALLRDGVAADRRDKAEARFDKTMARANSIAGINADLGASAIANPTAVPLNQLLRAALDRNPEIGRAAQGINRADAARLNAIFGYLPQISATYTFTQMEQNVKRTDNEVFELGKASYPVTNLAVELRQPILDMSRVFNIQLATTTRTTAEVEYIATVQRVLFETFDAYLVAAQSRQKMDELSKRTRLLNVQVSGESALSETGLADEQTMRSLQAERAKTGGEIAVESARYADSLGKLSYLTGTAISGVQPASVPRGVMGAERRVTTEAAVAAALEKNPQLMAVAMNVVEADLARKKAIATDFAPVLDAFARLEQEDRAASRFGGGSTTEDISTGVRLTLPIFNARGDGMRTLDANVNLREGVVAYHATKRQLETEIAMTLQRMAQLSSAMGQLQKAMGAAGANVRAERTLVETGESTEIQVVSRQLLESQLRAEMQYQQLEYMRAWARLQHLTGAISANVAD